MFVYHILAHSPTADATTTTARAQVPVSRDVRGARCGERVAECVGMVKREERRHTPSKNSHHMSTSSSGGVATASGRDSGIRSQALPASAPRISSPHQLPASGLPLAHSVRLMTAGSHTREESACLLSVCASTAGRDAGEQRVSSDAGSAMACRERDAGSAMRGARCGERDAGSVWQSV